MIFPALLTGGSLHIISEERIAAPNALSEYFRDNPIDCLKIVPSHLKVLLTASQPADVLPSQRLILGGEACSRSLIEQVQKLAPDVVIFNHYGPTEATVGATTCRIQEGQRQEPTSALPIGRPLANTQIYLLDSCHQLVPMGIPGELYIGGQGITRGYFNRAELTQERFIPNPFDAENRLYKTGDLARYLPDGNIEFLGRIDDQVKIRGFRIELGEIQACLAQHPVIQQWVVIPDDDALGDKRLIAYGVCAVEHWPAAADLRQFLQQSLPDYMIPSAFMRLEALPLTPNGKVDRRALPEPDTSQRFLDNELVAPRTLVEKTLVQIWCAILKLEQVSIHDNFFELGGHSLLATQMMSRIDERFELNFLLRNIFEAPTIADLGNRITTLLEMQTVSDSLDNQDMEEGEL